MNRPSWLLTFLLSMTCPAPAQPTPQPQAAGDRLVLGRLPSGATVRFVKVARILLHNTKAMLALPGRTYGMLGPGWQQENWRMGPSNEGRGFGTPEKWMPWVSTNHLYSITGLEAFDADLFRQLSAEPAAPRQK